MADNTSIASSSTLSPIHLPSSLSIPSSFRRTQSSKIESLVEYSYVSEDAQIQSTNLPLINPYNIYRRDSSITRSIRSLISTRRPHAKEYVQTSKMDQCSLTATSAEQHVTLEIPPHFVAKWKQEGYTHFHLGAVRIILSLHGRKGLPVTARVSLLDTRFLKFEHAVIGTVLKTLNAGSIVLTFFPNFNLSLQDLNLSSTFKIQVQLIGAEQISTAVAATIHHQLIYRLQNHALDMPTPGTSSEALLL